MPLAQEVINLEDFWELGVAWSEVGAETAGGDGNTVISKERVVGEWLLFVWVELVKEWVMLSR